MKMGEHICQLLDGCFARPTQERNQSPYSYSDAEYNWAKSGLSMYSRYVDLCGKAVLDAGCGLGGRTAYYAEQGCKSVVGIDKDDAHIHYSRKYALSKGLTNISFRSGRLESLPFDSNSFDIIFMNDVVEHISRPVLSTALSECKRVVKPNGSICLEFPPWTSWNAAHLDDYIHIPWCHFLFSRDTLINVIRRRNPKTGFGSLSVIEHYQALNRITIPEFMKLIDSIQCIVIYSYVRMVKDIESLKYIPVLNKYLISRFVAVLSKQ